VFNPSPHPSLEHIFSPSPRGSGAQAPRDQETTQEDYQYHSRVVTKLVFVRFQNGGFCHHQIMISHDPKPVAVATTYHDLFPEWVAW